jgi:hypothetical protein
MVYDTTKTKGDHKYGRNCRHHRAQAQIRLTLVHDGSSMRRRPWTHKQMIAPSPSMGDTARLKARYETPRPDRRQSLNSLRRCGFVSLVIAGQTYRCRLDRPMK